MDNRIIVLCGKSGCGKDTLSKMIEKLGYKFVISTTTRPIRPKESEGNPYYFRDTEYFKNLIENDGLIEYRTYNTLVDNVSETWYYGVENSEVNPKTQYVVVLDILGLKEFKKKFKNRITAFYVHVDDEERKSRAMKRGGFDETEWNRRLEDDLNVFSASELKENVDFVVYNYDLMQCFSDVVCKIIGKDIEVDDMEL